MYYEAKLKSSKENGNMSWERKCYSSGRLCLNVIRHLNCLDMELLKLLNSWVLWLNVVMLLNIKEKFKKWIRTLKRCVIA